MSSHSATNSKLNLTINVVHVLLLLTATTNCVAKSRRSCRFGDIVVLEFMTILGTEKIKIFN